jgi:hypothetical protein
MMGTMWWIVAIGVALPLVLAFMAGNCVETTRAKKLLSKVAIERRNIEIRRREIEAGWDELEAGWDELEAEKRTFAAGGPTTAVGRRRWVNLG